MPTVSLTLEEVDQSIVRQSILGIVKNLLVMTKLDSKISTILHGDIKYATTDNKFNAVTNNEANIPNVASDRKVVVSVSEEYDEDSMYATPIGQQEYLPIFLDPVAGLTIWPVYLDTSYVITFAYTTPSKTESIRWRDDMRAKLMQFRDMMIHDVTYDIILPEVVEEIISDVYDLRNRLLPQSLVGYFKDNSSKRIKLITDLTGGNAKLALSETQTRIVGLFDYSSGPEKAERDDEGNVYTITFNYKVTLNKPALVTMSYRPMVCNRLLPNKYFDYLVAKELTDKQEQNRDLVYSKSMKALSYFEAHRQLDKAYDVHMPVNVPSFDIVKDRSLTSGYCVLTTLLTQVDETDKRSLFNLKELEPYYLDKDFMKWIVEEEHVFIGSSHQSVLFLGYNVQGAYFNHPSLVVGSDLSVRSNFDLSLLSISRTYLNFIIDLTSLNFKVYMRLLNRPSLFIKFVLEWLLQIRNFPDVWVLVDKDANMSFFIRLIVAASYMFSLEDFLKLMRSMKKSDLQFYIKFLNSLFMIANEEWRRMILGGLLTKDDATLVQKGYTTSAGYAQQGLMKTVQTSYILSSTKEELSANH